MNIKPNILINRHAAGGDVLMTSPIVRKIYQDRKGECNIDFYVHPECKVYIENNPYIRNIYTGLPSPETIAKYDIYINLDLVYEKNPQMHAIDAYAMYAIGHTDFDRAVEMHTTTEQQQQAQQFRQDIGDYVVIHQRRFAWPSRNIPEKIWAGVVRELLSQTDLKIVQVGSTNEPAFTGNDRLIDARGQFSIPLLKEVVANGKLYLGSDSGPAHVASATETDMIVLYTSVREEFRRPLRTKGRFVPVATDLDCYGCHGKNPAPCTSFICHRGDIECVNRFDPEQIAQQAIKLINSSRTE